jgi:hypothetical protein
METSDIDFCYFLSAGFSTILRLHISASACLQCCTEAQFIVPDLGDKVDYGIGLSYWPVRLHIGWRAGTATLCLSPSKGLWIWLQYSSKRKFAQRWQLVMLCSKGTLPPPAPPARIFKLLRSPWIDSKESILPAYVAKAWIFKRLRSPGIDSKERIPLANVAWLLFCLLILTSNVMSRIVFVHPINLNIGGDHSINMY